MRAELLRFRFLGRGGREGGHLATKGPGELQRQVSQPADALNGHQVARPGAAVAQGVVGGFLGGARLDAYARAEAQPFRDGSFDTVLGLSMLTYLPEPARMLEEAEEEAAASAPPSRPRRATYSRWKTAPSPS